MIKRLPNFFGLGMAGELHTIIDDDMNWEWTSLNWRIYLGSWLIANSTRVSRKRRPVWHKKAT